MKANAENGFGFSVVKDTEERDRILATTQKLVCEDLGEQGERSQAFVLQPLAIVSTSPTLIWYLRPAVVWTSTGSVFQIVSVELALEYLGLFSRMAQAPARLSSGIRHMEALANFPWPFCILLKGFPVV